MGGKKIKELELVDLLKERWNVTKFKDKKIDEDDLEKILEAAKWSPSSGNLQPWELIVVKDSETREKIGQIHAKAMSGSGDIENIPDRYLDPPVLIALSVNTSVKEKYPEIFSRDFLINASVGTLIQNMWLMATSLGLGMGMGSQPENAQEGLKELLNVPENMWVPEVIQLGYPDMERKETERREISEFVHYEELDQSKLRDF